MRERKCRSLLKTITWRIIALALSYWVARAFGVDVATSIGIVVVANAVSTIAYYLHERVWDKIRLGKEA